MEVFSVGVDECDYLDAQLDGGLWLVYWYEIGDYCGDGEAVSLKEDGRLYFANLGHCSCYGPGDGGFSESCSVEDFLKGLENVHGYIGHKEVEKKVLELLGVRI